MRARMADQADLFTKKSIAVGTGGCAGLSQIGRWITYCLSFSAVSALCP